MTTCANCLNDLDESALCTTCIDDELERLKAERDRLNVALTRSGRLADLLFDERDEARRERDQYRADLETATLEIRTLRDALKTAMDDDRYRTALAKIREHCQRWANSANMTIEAYGRKQTAAVISHEYSNAGIDPKEFDE